MPSDEEQDAFDLVGMWVHPDARGRGVGEALVYAVAQWVEEQGARRICLWVTEENAPARQLYERCGFVMTGGQQPMPRDPSITEIMMARDLRRLEPEALAGRRP